MDSSPEGMPEFDKPENIPLIIPEKTAHLCTATKKDGKRCGFPKARGTEYCVAHDPSITKEQRKEWSAKKKGQTYKPRTKPKTKEELLLILSERMDKFLARFGDVISPEVDQTLCEMARTYVTVLKVEAAESDAKVHGWRMKGAV